MYIYIQHIMGVSVHVFVLNRHSTDISVGCMRPYYEYRQFTLNPEGGTHSNAILFDNRQQKNVPGYVCSHGSQREREAVLETLRRLMCSHALKHECYPSEVIPADVTGGDDVATRKYKSTCVGDSSSFKVKEAFAGMQEVWHVKQRLVPSGNHGYICNLGRSPSGTQAVSETLWE